MRRIFLTLLTISMSSTAFAHTGVGDTAGFLHGFEHPIGGVDHVLAMVAVGFLACVLTGRAIWLLPAAFVGMMVVGFIFGAAHVELPFVELGIALSSVVIGGAAALGRPMPVGIAAALVGVFAVFHGHAHGAEMPETVSGLTYAAGFVTATIFLHVLGIISALGAASVIGRHGPLAARTVSAVIAVSGVGLLYGWL